MITPTPPPKTTTTDATMGTDSGSSDDDNGHGSDHDNGRPAKAAAIAITAQTPKRVLIRTWDVGGHRPLPWTAAASGRFLEWRASRAYGSTALMFAFGRDRDVGWVEELIQVLACGDAISHIITGGSLAMLPGCR